jgi:hypothetical protein
LLPQNQIGRLTTPSLRLSGFCLKLHNPDLLYRTRHYSEGFSLRRAFDETSGVARLRDLISLHFLVLRQAEEKKKQPNASIAFSAFFNVLLSLSGQIMCSYTHITKISG